jgi:hypothetical protein
VHIREVAIITCAHEYAESFPLALRNQRLTVRSGIISRLRAPNHRRRRCNLHDAACALGECNRQRSLASHCILQCMHPQMLQVCAVVLASFIAAEEIREAREQFTWKRPIRRSLIYNMHAICGKNWLQWVEADRAYCARFAGNSISCGSSLRYLSSQPAWYEIEQNCTRFDRQEFATSIPWKKIWSGKDILEIIKIKLHNYENKFSNTVHWQSLRLVVALVRTSRSSKHRPAAALWLDLPQLLISPAAALS